MTFDQPWHQADAGIPETRYTRSGDVHIAYQTLGGGPGDLVFVAGFTSHCEHQWEQPDLARSLRRMGPARAVHGHAQVELFRDVRAGFDQMGQPLIELSPISETRRVAP